MDLKGRIKDAALRSWAWFEKNSQDMRGPGVEPLPSGWVLGTDKGSRRSVAEPPAEFWYVLAGIFVVILVLTLAGGPPA